jgi:hypothetical protein
MIYCVLSAFSMIVRLAWDLSQWCGLVLRPRESLEEIVSASAAGALSGARREAEAGRCGDPSDVDFSIALVCLAFCVGCRET